MADAHAEGGDAGMSEVLRAIMGMLATLFGAGFLTV
jgi:hypothetical protein